MKKQKYYGDTELIEWLNKEIRLIPPIIDIDKQFANWFFFQEIFQKTGNSIPNKKVLLNKYFTWDY